MMDRREILKLFGAGGTVVPLVKGELIQEAASRLIAPARVELIEAPLIARPIRFSEIRNVQILLTMNNGVMHNVKSDWVVVVGTSAGHILTGAEVAVRSTVFGYRSSPMTNEGSFEFGGTIL